MSDRSISYSPSRFRGPMHGGSRKLVAPSYGLIKLQIRISFRRLLVIGVQGQYSSEASNLRGCTNVEEIWTSAAAKLPALDLRVAGSENLREKTAKVFREAILTGRFRPGQRLVERELCGKAQVSRTSVREALRLLEAEGLIETRGTKGVFVTSLTPDLALEIYEVRAALEADAAHYFAVRASDDAIAQLEAIFRRAQRAAGEDTDELRRASDDYFELLMEGSGNHTAQRLMLSLRARISYLRARTVRLAPVARLQTTVRMLDTLTQAIRVRDGNAAAIACREIINRSAKFAVEVLELEAASSRETNADQQPNG